MEENLGMTDKVEERLSLFCCGMRIHKSEHFQDLSVYICRRVWDNEVKG